VSQTLARIERVTLEEAQLVAERVLSQPMTLTVLGPFPGGAFKEAMA
jgi:predicted Zn-dependent peptidase